MKLFVLLLTAITFVTISAAKPIAKARLGNITDTPILSPELPSSTSKTWRPAHWLEIEVPFTLSSKQKGVTVIPKLEVVWSFQLKNPAAKKNKKQRGRSKPTKYVLVETRTEYRNVPVGGVHKLHASTYFSPATIRAILKNFTGKASLRRLGIVNITVDFKIDGELAGSVSLKKSKKDWRKNDKLGSTDNQFITTVNKNLTPFRFHWWDRYPEIIEK